ncbi:DNA polymerase III subunit delta' [Candidatus Profftia sp. (ex Adelges kitamiensis)]|uniref:DNA polymerase III subunit delta' n=1 Tax=Candidatus Profftia sp. (ex Adelges kitamiensis) TaxID=2864218 RepID=UPI001CE2502B|nr:DNA polymerase III subunit delta' [Candidatus Profftia sp. (ex Adelges kitamiensis)]
MYWYPWLNISYHKLVKQYRDGRGHHALLIHALEGCGDDSLIYALIRWLLCQNIKKEKSCGKCRNCCLIIAGNHPDLYNLHPESGKSSLGIEPVRQIIEQIYTYTQNGEAKIIYLPLAEALTESAANALLKTLEEPPENTYFFLGTRNPANLLATLRSRCFYVYLQVPNEDKSINWMYTQKHLSYDLISMRTALRITNGAPIAALKLLAPDIWGYRIKFLHGLQQAILHYQWINLLPLLNNDNVNQYLTWLCMILLDAIKLQHGVKNTFTNLDQQHIISQLASTQTNTILQKQLENWIFCRHQLLTITGLNREIILTRNLCLWNQYSN